MRFFALFFSYFLFFYSNLFATETLLSTREITLPNFQFNQLKQDFPAKHIFLENQNTLWIAGKKSIWRWSIAQNTLKKIPISLEKNDELLKISVFDKRLYVLSLKSLTQLTFDPINATKLKTNSTAQFSVDLIIDKQIVYWVTNNQIYKVDHNTKKIDNLNYSINLTPADHIHFEPQQHLLWQIKKNVVLLHQFNNGLKSKTIHKTNHEIKNFSINKDNIFIATKHSILNFENNGTLIQTIPVENNRKLILMEHTVQKDSYLFSDKLLEVYELKNKNVKHYKLNLGLVKKADQMISTNNTLAFILDGFPRVFQLPLDEIKQ